MEQQLIAIMVWHPGKLLEKSGVTNISRLENNQRYLMLFLNAPSAYNTFHEGMRGNTLNALPWAQEKASSYQEAY